ncbi:MAG: 2-phospho-L-lactate guanylyltransferase [Acetobacteraceae bacterium]
MSPRVPIAALVPVRGLAAGKQRLAAALSTGERRALVEAMLMDVLDALRGLPVITLLAVVSADPAIAPIAENAGAVLLPDTPEGGLNASLRAALAWLAAARQSYAALIVGADLPAITPSLLETTMLASRAEIVIARSLDGGTNVLRQQPPFSLGLAFGAQSCARHRAAALAAGRTVEVIEHPMLARDVDNPEDLACVLRLLGPGRTRSLLEQRHLSDQIPATREFCTPRGFP